MSPKNRSFHVAGIGHYSTEFEEDDLVYFELEPSNPYDKNAIKILNKHYEQIGYVPRENAEEIQKFVVGKYPHYCARIDEVWEGSRGDDMPNVLAHFANNPKELPYPEQRWLNSKNVDTSNLKPKLPVALNWAIVILGFFGLYWLWEFLQIKIGGYVLPTAIVVGLGYAVLKIFLKLAITEKK